MSDPDAAAARARALAWLGRHERLSLGDGKSAGGRVAARLRAVRLVWRWWRRPPVSLVVGRRDGAWWRAVSVPAVGTPAVGPDPAAPGSLARAERGEAVVRRLPPGGRVSPGALVRLVGRGVWPIVGGLVGLTAAAAGLAMVLPVAIAVLFDRVIPDRDLGGLGGVALVLVGAALLTAATELGRAEILLRGVFAIDRVVQQAVVDRLLAAVPAALRPFGAEDLASRLLEAAELGRQVGPLVVAGLVHGGVFCASLGFLVWRDAGLALVALALAGGLAVATAVLARRQAGHRAAAATGEARAVRLIHEAVAALVEVRAAGAVPRLARRWRRLAGAVERDHLAALRAADLAHALNAGFALAAPALLFAVVAMRPAPPSLAGFLSFYAAYGQMLFALVALASAAASAAAAAVPLARLGPLAALPEEPAGAPVPAAAVPAAVELRLVRFRYASDAPLALDRVSIRVPAGALVALTGPSGSGKSTILRLVLKFEEPDDGEILIDGRPIRETSPAALRRQIGVVLQDSPLFDGTVASNIDGTGTRDPATIAETARLVGLDTVGPSLPHGLDTRVGRATPLPGGVKQQILLARALIGRPRLLLLDEATNVMDGPVQVQIAASVRRLGVTCLVVTHRLTLMGLADRIVRLDRGRVVEEGRFDALLLAGGGFARAVATGGGDGDEA